MLLVCSMDLRRIPFSPANPCGSAQLSQTLPCHASMEGIDQAHIPQVRGTGDSRHVAAKSPHGSIETLTRPSPEPAFAPDLPCTRNARLSNAGSFPEDFRACPICDKGSGVHRIESEISRRSVLEYHQFPSTKTHLLTTKNPIPGSVATCAFVTAAPFVDYKYAKRGFAINLDIPGVAASALSRPCLSGGVIFV